MNIFDILACGEFPRYPVQSSIGEFLRMRFGTSAPAKQMRDLHSQLFIFQRGFFRVGIESAQQGMK